MTLQVVRTGLVRLPDKTVKKKRPIPVRAIDAPIEDGVPFPAYQARRAFWKTKLYRMDVGQSFAIGTEAEAQSVRVAISHLRKRHAAFKGRVYKVKQVDLTEITWRCWRMPDTLG